jgi:putative endonuclease
MLSATVKIKNERRYACKTMSHYFYLARCCDGSLYSGSCVDLIEREAKHNSGKGAKYTRSRRPVKIIYHEEFLTRSEARRREEEVKMWKKAKKEGLIHRKDALPSSFTQKRSMISTE